MQLSRRALSDKQSKDGDAAAEQAKPEQDSDLTNELQFSNAFLSTLVKLATAGDPESQFKLASLYFKGERGVPKDIERAAHWVGLAAEGGVAQAQYNYAGLCFSGMGVEEDKEAGAEWYRL